MRLACNVLGSALMLLGCVGFLLLARGRFPAPVRNLLLGSRPHPVVVVLPGPPFPVPEPVAVRRGAPEAPAPAPLAAETAAPDDSAADGPGEAGAPGEQPEESTEGEALTEEGAALEPSPAPAPTATPAPTVQPLTLVPGQTQSKITGLRVPSIRLDSEVVPARLVSWAGVTTWEVPAFYVGHGLYTAGAGEPGNAILVGHVSSISEGNVFRDLDRVRVGDSVQVLSGDRTYQYVTTDVRQVPRTDLSYYAPTGSAAVTLVTCTGVWLWDVADFSERLVVRAELVATPTPTSAPTLAATATRTAVPTASATATPTPTPDATQSPAPAGTATAPPATATAVSVAATPTPAATSTSMSTATPTPPHPTDTPGQARPSVSPTLASSAPSAPLAPLTPLTPLTPPATVSSTPVPSGTPRTTGG